MPSAPYTDAFQLDWIVLYTAVTRGIETVVLVGDIDLTNAVLTASPQGLERNLALRIESADGDAE